MALERGNFAVVFFVFVGTLLVGAFLWVLFGQAWTPIIDMAANQSNSSAINGGINDSETLWRNFPVIVLVLTSVLGLSGAAAVSLLGGGRV